jgi:hypothetical protein
MQYWYNLIHSYRPTEASEARYEYYQGPSMSEVKQVRSTVAAVRFSSEINE